MLISAHATSDERWKTPDPEADATLDFPCSAAQGRFWVLEQMGLGSALNVAVRWQIDGPVETDRVEATLRNIVARHEVLRTTFHEVDGVPVQRVLPRADIRVAEASLADAAPMQREAQALAFARQEARRPFCLASAPLLRVTLLRLAPAQAMLLLTAHHLVCDGWSIGIIARELGLGYAASKAGALPTLPALPLQYADYALWQAEWMEAGGLKPHAEYWGAKLAGLQRFEVRPDHPRPAVPTGNSHIHSLLLPRQLTDRLQDLARRHAATMFSVALAGLSALLYRFTGTAGVSVSTQAAGRDDVELEHLVGLFINTLVLRLDLAGDLAFSEHVCRVRDTARDALANQRMPIDHVVSMLRPARELHRDPLVSVNFILQRSFITNASYGDITLTDLPSVSSGALYDFNFFMVERPDGWRLSCEYDTELFADLTIKHLLDAFSRLLAAAAADPDRAIAEYDLVGEAERDRLLATAGGATLPAALADQLPVPPGPRRRLYVVEPGGQLAMPNATGELWIGGFDPSAADASVAEAARFVADPFGPDARQTLYQSGALVRRRHDGTLEVLAAPLRQPLRLQGVAAVAKPGAGDATRSSVESRLATIWASVLGLRTVDVNESFFDQGGHSLLAARMLARVEASFGQRLSLVSLFQMPTVREFAALLDADADADAGCGLRDFEVVPVNPHGDRVPIFAINNSGLFHRLSRHLSADQPFISISAFDPGTPEELAPESFEAIAARYVSIVRQVQPHGPYVLLGLCVAGNLAFEAAQQLVRQGEQVPLVVLIDAWSPGYLKGMSRRSAALADLSYRVQSFTTEVRKLARRKLSLADFIGQRGWAKALRRRFLRRAHAAGRLRSVAADPYSVWFHPHLEEASGRYQPLPFDGFIQIFHSPDQPSGPFLDPTFGWGRLARGGIAVHAIPGDHMSIFDEPGAGIMADRLNQALEATGCPDGTSGPAVGAPERPGGLAVP